MNIRFNYLYRDGANYKQFGFLIFSNPKGLRISDVETRIRKALIDEEFFDPVKWSIPQLKFSTWDDEFDHSWNEFESIEFTRADCNIEKSINEFLEEIKRT